MKEEIVVRNITEDLVEMYMDECLERVDICKCNQCLADIRAYTLNNLPPHYVATKVGDVYVRLNTGSTQSKADILTAIMNGVNIVGSNPRHK